MPAVSRRADIREARGAVCQEDTPYGPVHQRVDIPTVTIGRNLKVEIQHPFTMLRKLASVSTCLNDLLLRTLADRPCSPSQPWHLIIYSDGFSPGNQLASHNNRKVQATYWAILEFGPAVLQDEEALLEL